MDVEPIGVHHVIHTTPTSGTPVEILGLRLLEVVLLLLLLLLLLLGIFGGAIEEVGQVMIR